MVLTRAQRKRINAEQPGNDGNTDELSKEQLDPNTILSHQPAEKPKRHRNNAAKHPTTQSCPKPRPDLPLQQNQSHWDHLPLEIIDMICGFAGKLAMFLNNRISVGKLTEKVKLDIWLDVFDQNWNGDLSLLPELTLNWYHDIENGHLYRIKCRDMYKRLCGRFPVYSENNTSYLLWDMHMDVTVGQGVVSVIQDDTVPRFRLLHIAMRNMWLDVLEERINQYPYAVANDCIVEGHVDLLRYLVETGKVDLKSISYAVKPNEKIAMCMNLAATSGRLEILKMLHRAGNNSIHKEAMNRAARDGRLDVVKWLHKHRREGCTTDAMNLAAGNGHLNVVKFLHEKRFEGCTTGAMDRAAWNGHVAVVKYLHENRTEGCTTKAMDYAAQNGHIDVVKYLHENRYEGCTAYAMDYAASNGHLNVVEYLHESRHEGCSIYAMNSAAANGHLDVVEWLHVNRSEGCTTKAVNAAAMSGHCRIVNWLLENRSEGFTKCACELAARNRHKEILEMLKAHSHLMH